jgi:hypothetical protein
MVHVLSQGNQIKIIHTIGRDLDELLDAISLVDALYMVGQIERIITRKNRCYHQTDSIYRNKDGGCGVRFRRRPNHAAANILYRDSAAVSAFAEEFNHYLHFAAH